MKGRGGGGGGGTGAGPTDLLVCFPSRAHLALMPKPICSPSRPSKAEPGKRHLRHPARLTISTAANSSRSHPSPTPLFAKPPATVAASPSARHARSPDVDDEPTSPKVTCAGQIKVGRPKPAPKPRPTKTWLSVVEEIERLRAGRTARREKKPTWLEAIGLKKDAWQFLGALRGVHFKYLGCFGSFRGAVESSTDDEEEEEEEEEDDEAQEDDEAEEDEDEEVKHGDGESGSGETRTIFSKWFMVLEQDQGLGFNKEEQEEELVEEEDEKEEDDEVAPPAVPPPNALLLMRCRSAPAKGLLSRRRREDTEDGAQVEKDDDDDDDDQEEEDVGSAMKMKREEEKEKERLVLMSYAPDFFKVSMDIAKETWLVGSGADPLARSRSWKR